MIKIFMAIPSTGVICDALPYLMRDLENKHKDQVEFVYPEACVQRKFHDFARNELVAEFLDTDCDMIWFIDSDVLPHSDSLGKLLPSVASWELAGCPYPVFMSTPDTEGLQVVFTVYKEDAGKLRASRVPKEGTEFVDGIGTGCMLIKREVFEQLSKPYFEFKYDKETMKMSEGEDLGFCRKVNELGYKFFVDYSAMCKHYKTVDLAEVNNYAISYSNISVQSYDADIRPGIQRLADEVQQLRKDARPKSSLILPGDV